MKIILAGGTGQLGRILGRRGHDIVVLSRGGRGEPGVVPWDGRGPGPWVRELDGAGAIVNLAGRSVNCRYNRANLQAMMDSRVASTRAVGRAIEAAERPRACGSR